MSRYSIAKRALTKSIIQKQEDLTQLQKELKNQLWNKTVNKILEKEAVVFVVQCSYEALLKLVSIYHYYQSYNANFQHFPDWKPDPIFLPSVPDAWGCRNIPVIPKSKDDGLVVETADSVLATPHLPTCRCYEIEEAAPEVTFSKERVHVDVLYENEGFAENDVLSCHATANDSSISNKPWNSPETIAEDSFSASSNVSSFTKFVKSEKDFRVCPIQEVKSKSHKSIKLPKIDVPPLKVGKNEAEGAAVELPPIRMETKYFTKSGDAKDKKRSKKW